MNDSPGSPSSLFGTPGVLATDAIIVVFLGDKLPSEIFLKAWLFVLLDLLSGPTESFGLSALKLFATATTLMHAAYDILAAASGFIIYDVQCNAVTRLFLMVISTIDDFGYQGSPGRGNASIASFCEKPLTLGMALPAPPYPHPTIFQRWS